MRRRKVNVLHETVGKMSETLRRAIRGDLDGVVADLERFVSEHPTLSDAVREGLLVGASLSQQPADLPPAVGDFLDRMAAAPAAAEGIRTVRKMIGLTQGELGKRLGVDDSTVSRWERGEKRMSDKSMRALVEQMASLDGVPVPSPPVQISGEGLRKLRGLMRLSREDFAQKIGVSPRTVSLYEGRREVPKACAKRVAMVALEYGINLSAAA